VFSYGIQIIAQKIGVTIWTERKSEAIDWEQPRYILVPKTEEQRDTFICYAGTRFRLAFPLGFGTLDRHGSVWSVPATLLLKTIFKSLFFLSLSLSSSKNEKKKLD